MPGPGLDGGGSVAILNGQSDGTFATAQYLGVSVTQYASPSEMWMEMGRRISFLSPAITSVTRQFDVFFGDGKGNFQAPAAQQTFAAIFPMTATLADLDGDGKPDLLLATRSTGASTATTLEWLKNTGGGFTAPVSLGTIANALFHVADFNGDGEPDILYENNGQQSQTLHILMNQGGGHFLDQAAGGLNGVIGDVTVMDFNLDGTQDLVVDTQQGISGLLYTFAGQGDGTFVQVATTSTPGDSPLVAGDFDHDGFPDLVGSFGHEPGALFYFFGDGHGNFTSQEAVGPLGGQLLVGDVNGDGLPDVFVPDLEGFVTLALSREPELS